MNGGTHEYGNTFFHRRGYNIESMNPQICIQGRDCMTKHRTFLKPNLLVTALFFVCIILFFSCFAGAETDSMLETGMIVNAKMKSLAAGSEQNFTAKTNEIKAIRMASLLPDDFVPSGANTVSTPDSKYPIYIFFDNRDDAGIVYFYTEIETIAMNPDSSYMFVNNLALTDISGIANWDTSHVTNMHGLFSGAGSLTDALALRNWDTSNVTDMERMFSNATSLMFIDVTNWNTSKVTSMASMFQVGENLKGNGQLIEILGLGNLDVSNVTDMTCMFYGAGQMQSYDIAGWDVSKVESMNHMFCDNHKLRSLDLSSWDVSNVKTMCDMFDDNFQLRTIGDVSHWNTSSLIDAGGWLNGAKSFVGDNTGTLDLSGWDTSKIKTVGEMFTYTKLHTIDLSGWTFDSVTNEWWEGANTGIYYETGNDTKDLQGFGAMFKNATSLTTVYVSQAGLDSYQAAVENGVNTLDMWTATKTNEFTVK